MEDLRRYTLATLNVAEFAGMIAGVIPPLPPRPQPATYKKGDLPKPESPPNEIVIHNDLPPLTWLLKAWHWIWAWQYAEEVGQ